MRRLFFPFQRNSFILDGDAFHHWVRVNRARVGDIIEVVNEAGEVVQAELTVIEEDRGHMQVLREIFQEKPWGEITLALGLLKGEKMDWVIQKSVELGVHCVQPLVMDHSIVKLDTKKKAERQKRWQKISLEAAQQSGAAQVPMVKSIRTLDEVVVEYAEKGTVWVPHEGGRSSYKEALRSDEGAGKHLLIVGPEGGFSERETEALKKANARLVTLGRQILRAETAAITALALMLYEWDYLGGSK